MNASTRVAALPDAPTTVRKSPRSFFLPPSRVKGRPLHRTHLHRIPTAFKSFTTASATTKNGGMGTSSPA